ncbi:WhiB family transcriptional regulator [Nocardiopsis akebiae]|uniref:Transcriptional regulator WhiB n=1 Tax=Nocardiopsis akebiae TaxID=2831968 RepID=A0ABX8C876_9ACTN|nr:WhiB family transcriptional regulator [Nocardiopsis akebiae]QUX30611.1 WhiB family transcriptional regulator [Nocardiopsis akebiae]
MSLSSDTRAACRRTDIDPDTLFVTGRAQREVTRICRSCAIRLPSLPEALKNQEEHGMWGGMTARQRRQLLQQHPTDWEQAITTPVPAMTGRR